MKLIFVLLFFVKFSFAYQVYNRNGFNITSADFHKELCNKCEKFCEWHPHELKDDDIFDCLNYMTNNHFTLYCEPPKILDDNNECVSEISSEEWQKVVENSTGRWIDYIYLENMNERENGKVLSKRIITEGYRKTHFAAIGKTADGEYKMHNLKTCYDEVAERNLVDLVNEDTYFNSLSMLKISMPQLVSIIFFLLLLIFYLTIEELRKTVHGKCWINFLTNSLINYSAAIFQLIFLRDVEDVDSTYSFDRDGTDELKFLQNVFFNVSSTIIIFTEFSLYFWLNITFFEAFYILR
jgi:hypothetical protein